MSEETGPQDVQSLASEATTDTPAAAAVQETTTSAAAENEDVVTAVSSDSLPDAEDKSVASVVEDPAAEAKEELESKPAAEAVSILSAGNEQKAATDESTDVKVEDDAVDGDENNDEEEEAAGEEEDDDEDDIVKERMKVFASGKDFYCWQCHKERGNISCNSCPRSFHRKCLPTNSLFEGQVGHKKHGPRGGTAGQWTCPECRLISEGEERRKSLLSAVPDEDFNQLLISALGTIKTNAESLFYFPVSDVDFPEYRQFIFHPVDFQSIDRNVRRGVYKSTDGFTADVKWILHNCIIYNSPTHVLTKNANYFFKVAKTEMGELEVCPDCFKNYYQFNKTYFIETCSAPHRLVWARLKGHPFWPAKLVRVDLAKREGDCRFFGAHDRAWVPFDSLFLLSQVYPWTKSKSHKSKLEAALTECRAHIDKLEAQFPGVFAYAEPKTAFNFADACLHSNQVIDESLVKSANEVMAPVVIQKSVIKGREKGRPSAKQVKAEAITQNKKAGKAEEQGIGEEEDSLLDEDDEERPLIIDAPVEETAAVVPSSASTSTSTRRKTKLSLPPSSSSLSSSLTPSTLPKTTTTTPLTTTRTTSGVKRKASDSGIGKNKAISSGTEIPVKKSSSAAITTATAAASAQSTAGNGSEGSVASAAAAKGVNQKSKIPTKKAISVATSGGKVVGTRNLTPASKASPSQSSSSSSSSLAAESAGRAGPANRPPVSAARSATSAAAGKRTADTGSAPLAHKGPANVTTATGGGRKARLVNTGTTAGPADGSAVPPFKRSKLAAGNERSLLSGDKSRARQQVDTRPAVSGTASSPSSSSSLPDVSLGKNKSRSRIAVSKSAVTAAAVTHAANGSLLTSGSTPAPESVVTRTNNSSSPPHTSSSSSPSPLSPTDTSFQSSGVKNCSPDTKGRSSSSSSGLEVKQLKDEIKRLKDQVSKLMIEMQEMRTTTESQITTQVSLEKEKAVQDLQSKLSKSFAGQLEDTKRKQWCAHCLKEAIYFCCWNTSYCGYECQNKHWPSHMPACQQNSKNQSAAGSAAAVTAAAAAVTAAAGVSAPAATAPVAVIPVTTASVPAVAVSGVKAEARTSSTAAVTSEKKKS